MKKESFSREETAAFAAELAAKAKAGDVFALSGDLGAGKTVFAKGFAKGLGVEDDVTSPTFTILQSYQGSELKLHHFDVYRIENPDEMEEIGLDWALDDEAACLIEWPERIEELLPARTVRVRIERDPDKGEGYRLITVDC